jgi:hypothetical protein
MGETGINGGRARENRFARLAHTLAVCGITLALPACTHSDPVQDTVATPV